MVKKFLSKLNQWFNACLIEKNPVIVEEMARYNQTCGRIEDHRKRAKMVAGLYLRYGILHRSSLREFEKRLCTRPFPESRYSRQSSLEKMEERLEMAENIVFDVWDVLLCTGLDGFQMRALCECEALHPGISEYGGSFWVDSASDDFSTLHLVVKKVTLDNAVMHTLWKTLRDRGKNICFYNNSDYDDQFVMSLLGERGYHGDFFSGDKKEAVRVTAEAQACAQDEWGAVHLYRNIHHLGNPYRTYYDHNAVTCLTDRIGNLLLHGDEREKSIFYEYGTTCGGILTCGFCQWLNDLADRKNIDLFLFVARDGDIMQKIYQRHYAKHESAYLAFSRFASFELIFGDYPEEYIDKNIKPRMARRNCDNTIAAVLRECGLDFMESRLPDEELDKTDILNEERYEAFKQFLLRHMGEIATRFQTSCEAAAQYYGQLCRGHHNICVVDLGWHGKSIIYLKYFMEKKCGMDVRVTGAMIGAAPEVVVQDYIRKDMINVYAFENDKWRSPGSRNGEQMDYQEILCTELLFSSPKDTLLRYTLGEKGETVFLYGRKNENVYAIQEIHRGISDFAEKFAPIRRQCGFRVLARDAYTPLYYTLKNKKLCSWLFENYREEINAINGFE